MTTKKQWLTDDEQRAWRALIGVVMLLPSSLDRQLEADSGLSHFEYGVLAMLSEAPDHTLRMSQLAALNDSSLSRLSHVARRMEERGLIVRRTCPEDRRANIATLTEAGMTKIVAAAPAHVATVRELIFNKLTPTQIANLEEVASVIRSSLNHDEGLPPALS